MTKTRAISALAAALAVTCTAALAGVCPTEPLLENHLGAGTVSCPCFVAGEQAGAVFDLPPGDFPIQILKVGIGWGSVVGGQPDSLEQAFHVYPAGLPNPGVPIFTQEGPVLTDGVINLFDVEVVEQVIVNSGPFTVTLELANDNLGGGAFTPTPVHDGAGCIPGRNPIFAIPGGWLDACGLGVSGNWVFVVEYRKVVCGPVSGPGVIPDGALLGGTPLTMTRGAAGTLDLFWGASCSATDTTYSVYEGTMAPAWSYNHLPKNCDTGGTMANVSPSGGNTYYLVVPRDATNEGSYGVSSDLVPRPPAIATCRPPVAATCP